MTEHARSRLSRELAVAMVAVTTLVTGELGGCRRSPPAARAPERPCLESIHIEDASGQGRSDMEIDTGALSVVLRGVLISSGIVSAQSTDGGQGNSCPALRVTGRVGFETTEVGPKGVVRSAVSLRLATRPSDAPGAITEDLSAASERPYDVRAGMSRRRLGQESVERTATDLLGGLLARLRLETAPPAEIHRAMQGDAGELRFAAIRAAGTRGLREEVPALLALLQNDDESLRDAALGALIALREPRAVSELTRNRSLRDRHEMRKILEAIAIIGGEEAENYLSFVAESHDDEEIRKLAAEAKSRMERHGHERER